MLIHTVLLCPASGASQAAFDAAMQILEQLAETLPSMVAFHHGPNRDFEAKSQAYTYGFTCHFTDRAALEAYAADPDHRRAGALLVAHCKGGADGIFVSDLAV